MKSTLRTALTLAVSCASLTLCPELHAAGKITGILLEKGTRRPLAEASVFVLPLKKKVLTDAQGRFEIEGVEVGAFQWVVNLPGYIRFEQNDEQPVDGQLPERKLFVERDQYQIYETTVFGKGDKRDDSRKSIKPAEVYLLPGTGNDPVKAVQNLPGVNRPQSGASSVIIQGSAPNDTRYQIDGHEVPLIFHFGGLTSVMPPETLDRVDYFSAGYGSENGRALGGLVTVQSRAGKKDRIHGVGYFDALSAGLILEGPVGEKGSLIVGGRQSYVGEILKAVLKNKADLSFTVAPTYGDLTAIYDLEVTPRDRFRLTSIGSTDRLQFLFDTPSDMDPSVRGTFDNKTSFFRLIPQWTHTYSDGSESKFSVGIGRDLLSVEIGDSYFSLQNTAMTTRGEYEKRFSELWKAHWGFDHRYSWASVDLKLRTTFSEGGVANPFSTGTLQQVTVSRGVRNLGLYWRNEWKPSADSAWTLLPSIRGEYYSTTREVFALPRFAARYKWDDSLTFRLGSGVYTQPPAEQNVDSTTGNPDIKAPRAYHLALSAEKDLRGGSSQGWVITPGVFYKYFEKLIVNSTGTVQRDGVTVPEIVNNSGLGRSFGFETLAKLDLSPWTGWLSYTLSRSTRAENGGSERAFQYDQTHLLTAIVARDFSSNWRVGARLRYTTGNPLTPITSAVFDADNDVYVPVRGEIYSERLGSFFQLDVRVDKKWIYNNWILMAYLDVQNATNHKNVEQVQYAYDYSSKVDVASLPVIPSIGLRAEF